MYFPSEEAAVLEQEKFSLSRVFDSAKGNRFHVGISLDRGHLVGKQILEKHFVDSEFSDLQFLGSDFINCNWDRMVFKNCEIRSVRFWNCSFREVQFENCSFDGVVFRSCYFEKSQIDFKQSGVLEEESLILERLPLSDKKKLEQEQVGNGSKTKTQPQAAAKPALLDSSHKESPKADSSSDGKGTGESSAGRFGNLEII